MPKRRQMTVSGLLSRTATLVAMNDAPQTTTAKSAPRYAPVCDPGLGSPFVAEASDQTGIVAPVQVSGVFSRRGHTWWIARDRSRESFRGEAAILADSHAVPPCHFRDRGGAARRTPAKTHGMTGLALRGAFGLTLAAQLFMPARPRRHTGQLVFHVFNRAIQTMVLFEEPPEYEAFLEVLRQAVERYRMRLLAYTLMPNHWHFIVWPREDACLSSFMQWLTVTHAKQWREARGTTGRGAVYQGRFKAVAVQRDRHLLVACAYVETNAFRAHLVDRAEDWPWSSASPLAVGASRPALAPWPVDRPADWTTRLNAPKPASELEDIRTSIRRGLPLGTPAWRAVAMSRLKWPVSGPRGRPPGSRTGQCREMQRALASTGVTRRRSRENLALLTGSGEEELAPPGPPGKDSRDLAGRRACSRSAAKRFPRPQAGGEGADLCREKTPETSGAPGAGH
jgi:putative transposase